MAGRSRSGGMRPGKLRRVPTILQMEASECGAASLAMVLASFGRYLPPEQLRVETGVSRDGASAANLRRCAKKYGLDCKALKREPERLRQLPMPCILHWEGDHFVVLEGFRGKHAWLNDPARGRRRLTMEELAGGFSGVVLCFALTERFEKQKRQHRVLPFLRERLKGQRGILARLLCVGLLLLLPVAAVPLLSGMFVDDVLGAGRTDWLGRLLPALLACLLIRQALVFYRGCLLSRWRAQLSLLTGRELLSRLLRLPIPFFDQRYASDLVSRVESNDAVCAFLAGDLAERLLDLGTALCCLILLFLYSVPMTLVCLGCTLVSLGAARLAGRVLTDASQRRSVSAANLYDALCGGISAAQSVKASGAEQTWGGRLQGFLACEGRQEERLSRAEGIMSVLPDGLGQLTAALLLIPAVPLLVKGELTVGTLVSFQLLYTCFREPVGGLLSSFRRWAGLRADVLRVDDIRRFPLEEEKPDERRAERLHGKLSGQVELRDVSFGYSPVGPEVISGMSFSLPSGGSLALVGPSGCGKSTVGRLISGLYAPGSGEVLFDGLPAGQIPERIRSASVSTVSQQAVLFSGTIRDNLTMWNRAVLEEDLIRAARDACIHEDIVRLPGGYDFRLTDGGSNLSGGQRQRLQIARALVTGPSILVLDEATSALDPVTEQQVMENLRRRGCTLVIAAHRLSTVRDCKQILVLEDGRVVQRGDHESLLREEGLYRALVGAGSEPEEVSPDA